MATVLLSVFAGTIMTPSVTPALDTQRASRHRRCIRLSRASEEPAALVIVTGAAMTLGGFSEVGNSGSMTRRVN